MDSYQSRALQQICPYCIGRDDALERDAMAETAAILDSYLCSSETRVRTKTNSGKLLRGHNLQPVSL